MTEILAVKTDFFKYLFQYLFHVNAIRTSKFQQLQIFPLTYDFRTNEEFFPITDGKYRAFNSGHLEKMKCINVNTDSSILLARSANLLHHDLWLYMHLARIREAARM